MSRTRDGAQVAEARRLYHLGLDTRAIGAHLNVDSRTVGRWLGDETRQRGPRGRRDVADQRILSLRDGDGLTFEEIARRVHMSKTGVRMRYYALTGRPRPERS